MSAHIPPVGGNRRVLYDWAWYSWALPLAVGLSTSYFPTATSGLDLSTWDVQHVLVVRVLCCRAEIVLYGPLLFAREDDE